MARIAGIELPNEKPIWVALTYIFGIGRTSSLNILKATGVNPQKRARDLTDDEINRIRTEIDRNYKVEGDLRREIQQNIQRLISIGCYRGMRHRLGLPVRGQRTKTNARTRKGPRKTIGVGRKAKEAARKGH
jgi:small subunit ribosomal protein S13